MDNQTKGTIAQTATSSGLLEPHSPTLTVPLPTGSATGNPRNKCALKPGHSLMDWIRIGNSGRDLTGVGGKLHSVTHKELAQHNAQNDAWLALRGKVYNITQYLHYHPGGVEELMRGAGIDATKLFEQIHPWVNYESLLAKCLIGPLRIELCEPIVEPKSLVRRSVENLAGKIAPKKKDSKILASLVKSTELPLSMIAIDTTFPPPPRLDWIQTTEKCTIFLYIGPFSNPTVFAQLGTDGAVVIKLTIEENKCDVRIVPEKQINKIVRLFSHVESGKIEVVLKKSVPDRWNYLGAFKIGSWERRMEFDWSVRLEKTVPIAKDVLLFSFSPMDSHEIVTPVASYLKLNMDVEGSTVTRSYTPLGIWLVDSLLNIAVKVYPNGPVSSRLKALSHETVLKLSGPYTSFALKRLKNVGRVYLFAAGSGITPMLSLIAFLLQKRNPKCQAIELLYFNKTEEDIIFKDKLTEMAHNDERFKVEHILSEASISWAGRTGRVRRDLVAEFIETEHLRCSAMCNHFFFICGPNNYMKLTKEIVSDLGCRDSCIHEF